MELLAPAKDLSTAIKAFESGADAVYLGMEKFSARQSATNFTISDLRRLKEFSQTNDKRIFVAINTILEDQQFDDLKDLCLHLQLMEIDAVIIQDLGVANFIKKHFPSLTIHASTQMAVHNDSGIKFLKQQGIKRVVLSRELGLKQISKLAKDNPDMELEVFIHGALCYSFSGMCLASGLMLDRSANAGTCAQICRNYFKQNEKQGHYFSCNDLSLYKDILKLKEAGITSAKIEGRMKSIDYVTSNVKLYRNILDTNKIEQDLIFNSQTSFSRNPTKGYFNFRSGEMLINSKHAGHMGIYLGKVEKVQREKFQITPTQKIELFDSLSIHKDRSDEKVCGGTIKQITSLSGRPLKLAHKDEKVLIQIRNITPELGDIIFLSSVSSRDKETKLDIKKYPLFKKGIDIECSLYCDRMEIKTCFDEKQLQIHTEIKLEESENKSDIGKSIEKQFQKSGDSFFIVGKIDLKNFSTTKHPFFPPSQIKEIKNEFYQKCNELFLNRELPQISNTIKGTGISEEMKKFCSHRANLNPDNGKIPFILNFDQETTPAKFEEIHFLPLNPILINEADYFQSLQEYLEKNSDKKFAIGINNLSHIPLVKKIASPNISTFFDFYIYLSNSNSIDFYKQQLPDTIFGYHWVEKKNHHTLESISMIALRDHHSLPYFISLGCFHKHNFQDDCQNCKKSYQYELTNNNQRFIVIIKDCMTFLFKQ